MDEYQILLVKKSWRIFRDIDSAIVGDVFYSKLFSYKPGLRSMFPVKMNDQYNKLADMISMLVARMNDKNAFAEEITAMARRHVHYGVRPAHYKLVGKALLWTLEKGLSNDWTPAVKEAWVNCYTIIAEMMIAASVNDTVK